WASEPPTERVVFRKEGGGERLFGRKPWCSGASIVDTAIVSAWTENGEPILVEVGMRRPGVRVETDGWFAVGMAASRSVAVVFDGASARGVGEARDYTERPGFWQGGAGIAA